jgi:plastocyanin
MQNLMFSPATLTVTKGDDVVFSNLGQFMDNIKINGITSPNIPQNTTWTLHTSLLDPGTYSFTSTLHTYNPRGTLTIQ